eukprot:TRINITY_DN1629_c6_g1_i1.p1 TRINITY_DN1629_c6_g1~~TRINITY_DN1629_c6_g1_i1.p1  ORF type:complete len:391 (-),score=117.50 TRINITY_DN1629_c6_g1_i1:44-1147(-)
MSSSVSKSGQLSKRDSPTTYRSDEKNPRSGNRNQNKKLTKTLRKVFSKKLMTTTTTTNNNNSPTSTPTATNPSFNKDDGVSSTTDTPSGSPLQTVASPLETEEMCHIAHQFEIFKSSVTTNPTTIKKNQKKLYRPFTGHDFIDWLVHSKYVESRDKGVSFGKKMKSSGLIDTKGQPFRDDDDSIYQFTSLIKMQTMNLDKALKKKSSPTNTNNNNNSGVNNTESNLNLHFSEDDDTESHDEFNYYEQGLLLAREWLMALLSEELPSDTHELEHCLKDGSVLCRAMDVLKPGCIKVIYTRPINTTQVHENITNFLIACKTQFGMEEKSLFKVEHLQYGENMKRVAEVLISLVVHVEQEVRSESSVHCT